MKKRIVMAITASIFALAVMGCGGGYYRVTDPGSSKVYYTSTIKKKEGGRIEFKDANTGSTVTLQSSEVLEIEKKEFKENTSKK